MNSHEYHTLILGITILFLSLLLSHALRTASAADYEPTASLAVAGQIFTVNSTADPGSGTCDATECTLREAITAANGVVGSDTIGFNIPGVGPHTITPVSPLPVITSPVVIDGYTQPGASANTLPDNDNAVLMIVVDLSAAGGGGISISAGSSTVRGLVINHGGIGMDTNGNNSIEGNFIGTNVAGATDTTLGTGNGVLVLFGSSNNIIGGTTPAARNLISNNGAGVALFGGTGNLVQGNFIGTDRTGSADLGNGTGISVSVSTNNTIGGTTPGARNVISGNTTGISVGAANTVIQGNYIGVNASGGAFTGNGGLAISVGSSGAVIGGTTPASRNVISGHSIGIGLNTAPSTTVQGNLIGTNAAGTAALGNANSGLAIANGCNNTLIGGTSPGAGNVISANGTGIFFNSGASTGVTVQGNLIGTDANGTADLGNITVGINVSTPEVGLVIGGSNSAARNVISGNNSIGLFLASSGSTVQGNLIGTAIDGSSPLGNGSFGMQVSGSNNQIGGTAAGTANVIAFNGDAGVSVPSGTNNALRHNSIYSNAALGIDLGLTGSGGPTLNDSCDSDTGPNNLQNFPVVTSAITSGGSTTIQGTLDSATSTTFTIDLYSSSSPDPSVHGEGETYLGSTTAVPGSGCSYTFSLTTSSPVTTGHVVTATATDPTGNTSEFSNTRQVLSPTAATASISGRITTDDGAPLGGVLMSLTGGSVLRRTFTNSQGVYQFPNVATDSFYSVDATRVNYAFAPAERSFSLLANTADADFAAHALPATANPLDSPEFFVRQHYLDFLNREPDEAGLEFWTNEITACGADAQCIANKRENVSAAFFLSIEFQETGFLVHRFYKTAFGQAPRLAEFLPAQQTVSRDVVVGSQNWEERLADNQRAFTESFARRDDFQLLYDDLSNEEYVDRLYQNADLNPNQTVRDALIAALHSGAETRATVLRRIAESEELTRAEFRRAFVLMQYFGYLRRNPNDLPDTNFDGYNFWLAKLNSFEGDFVRAEMVKAFLISTEYRGRFGPH